MPTVDRGYRRDIDGLRAVAISLVILFHAFPEYPNGGFVGVDVFFVISGYLISGLLMNELRVGHFSLLGFYARRCRRIVPALAVVLIAVLVGGWFLLLPDEYVEAARGILGGAAFVSNILLWRQAGYFDASAAVKPLLHLWSLGIEEQFYVVWPLMLWAAYRWRINLAAMIGVLLAGSFILMLQWPRTQAFYFLPSRFWELLLGGGLAYLERYQPGRMDAVLSRLLFIQDRNGPSPMLQHVKGVVAIGLLAWSGVTLANNATFPSWNALPPTLAAFLLISAGRRGWVNRAILSSAPAVFIGRISFPLYLWHWPLLSFAHIIVGSTPPLETRIALMALAVILAWLTWRLVERPIQRWLPTGFLEGTRFGAIRLVMSSVVLLIMIGSTGRAIIVHHGFETRVTDTPREFYSYVNHMKRWNTVCQPLPHNWVSWCATNTPGKVRFALYGDSHAEHYQPGLLGPQTASDGWLFIGRPACPPVLNVDVSEQGADGHCDANSAWAQGIIDRDPDIKTVVMSSMTTPYFNDSKPSAYSRDGDFTLSSTVYKGTTQEIYFQGFAAAVANLLAAGKRVVIMIDTPELNFDLGRCAAHRPLQPLLSGEKALPCAMPRALYLARNQAFRQMVATLKRMHPSLLVYDPINLFCNATMCNVFRDGHSLYRDGDHLSVYGSEFAAAHFLEWLGQQGIPLSSQTDAYADARK